jgi:hypothetical protein
MAMYPGIAGVEKDSRVTQVARVTGFQHRTPCHPHTYKGQTLISWFPGGVGLSFINKLLHRDATKEGREGDRGSG